MEEEFTRFFVGPVFWNGVFLLRVLFDELDNLLKGTMFPDEFQSSIGPDFGDWVEVVTA